MLEHARMSCSNTIVVFLSKLARTCLYELLNTIISSSYELLAHYTYCSFRLAMMKGYAEV